MTEPSDDYACADMNGAIVTDRQAAVMWMRRAEAAEAQLAAVWKVIGTAEYLDSVMAGTKVSHIRALLTSGRPGC